MSETIQPEARQIWGPTTTKKHHTVLAAECTAFELPAGGVLVFNESYTTTLHDRVVFNQPCEYNSTANDPGSTGNATVVGNAEPFYASVPPQIYALATATVLSYILVILIFVTPRSFFHGGNGGRFLGSSGVMGSSNGHPAVTGIGRRPWLQKIATVTTAVSLTIATADTFSVAETQYDHGYIDSSKLVDQVVGSVEIRVIQVIAYAFLWLAQVQTLIRLFPRHKEKVTIKWLGFALVTLDTVFSILDDFVDDTVRTRPRTFQDAIPALNYLFDLAISLIYAACVIYYSISKRRFAFWHSKMPNICLMATLSYSAILIPIVFFIIDVANPDLARWGDYLRWVGAAAASVVVWEWVERIEALERDERKDGILGREIFDGDEMLDDGDSDYGDWPVTIGRRDRSLTTNGDTLRPNCSTATSRLPHLRFRLPQTTRRHGAGAESTNDNTDAVSGSATAPMPSIPPTVASPISRTDTTSASTVYAVRFHPNISEAFAPHNAVVRHAPTADPLNVNESSVPTTDTSLENEKLEEPSQDDVRSPPNRQASLPFWHNVKNPFKRKRMLPPAEVADAQRALAAARVSPVEKIANLRPRARAFASARRYLGSGVRVDQSEELPVTVIPAQRRGNRVWSPDAHFQPQSTDTSIVTIQNPGEAQEHHASEAVGREAWENMPVPVVPAPSQAQRTWAPEHPNLSSPTTVNSIPDVSATHSESEDQGELGRGDDPIDRIGGAAAASETSDIPSSTDTQSRHSQQPYGGPGPPRNNTSPEQVS